MIGRVLGWILLAAGILAGSQFVQFTTQYRIGLAHRVAELEKKDIAGMRDRAQRAGLSLESWVRHFEQNDDAVIRDEGHANRATIARAQRLQEDLDAIRAASAITLPFVFASHLDGDVLQTARKEYTPGIPADLIGWIYTGIGALIGLILGAVVTPQQRWRSRSA